MHILEVNTVYKFGSTGRIVNDLKDTLETDGHKVTVACGREFGKKIDDVHIIGSKSQSHFDALTTRVFDNAGFGLKKPTQRLISIIEKENPDIIHLHNIHGYYINIKCLFEFLKKSDRKIVWTFHDCWPFTGHCAYFDYANCEKWRTGCNNCDQKNKYPSSYLFDCSKKNYLMKKELFNGIKDLTIVTPSEWLHDLVKQSFLCNYDVVTINNGIDLNVFRPTESDLRCNYHLDNKIIILAVASIWGERKGFYSYLKLSKMLPENYIIVMIGVNDNQIHELPKNIIGIKRTSSQQELAAWYSAADVFLSLTEEDNFPTVNLESLACGLPVMANKVGGACEAFDQITGIELEKGNLEEVASLIINKKYKEISRKACVERAKRFEKTYCYYKYEQLFSNIVHR